MEGATKDLGYIMRVRNCEAKGNVEAVALP